jgi:two-component system, OmpR family, sensor kinase
MRSLRRTILIWITILLATLGAGAAVASYYFTKYEADKLLDAQLRQIALNAGEGLSGDALPHMTHSAEDEISIQIWNAAGEMMLHASSVRLPRQAKLGFADIDFAGKSWRVYTSSDGERTAQVAQRWTARNEIAGRAAYGAALPILAATPIVWIIIYFAVNRLLGHLSKVAETLAERSIDAKDPVAAGKVPAEIAPLIVAMNALMERYQTAVERQRRFVSDAAHELRTPLAALQIQVDNLGSHVRPGGVETDTVDELNAGVRRATALVTQLLKMARLESASPHFPRNYDLAVLVGEVVADHVAIANRKNVDLGMSIPTSFDCHTDDPETRLLLMNLVDNAVKYTPSGGTVDVVLKTQGHAAVVEIIDSGCGIPAAALPRIYDRFFRAAPPDTEGTGLGLAIAQAVADRNGFRLTIENRADASGVMARICIPMIALNRATLSTASHKPTTLH